MSKGPGHVQRAILDLIAGDSDGAWHTAEICLHVYKGKWPEKRRRVAVLRALRSMILPGTWTVKAGQVCTQRRPSIREWLKFTRSEQWPESKLTSVATSWLCDPCNLASMQRKGGACDSVIRDRVAEACRWRDASPLERLEIEIQEEQQALDLLAKAGMPAMARECRRRLTELKMLRAAQAGA